MPTTYLYKSIVGGLLVSVSSITARSITVLSLIAAPLLSLWTDSQPLTSGNRRKGSELQRFNIWISPLYLKGDILFFLYIISKYIYHITLMFLELAISEMSLKGKKLNNRQCLLQSPSYFWLKKTSIMGGFKQKNLMDLN